jgi:hypothetical protein
MTLEVLKIQTATVNLILLFGYTFAFKNPKTSST